VNNLPGKICTYSCVYCQAGRTARLTVERAAFCDWREVVEEVDRALRAVGAGGVDYVTFVPSGEPLLDANLGRAVRAVRDLGVRVAVLTNASLLWREDCRADAAEADLVSVKVDAASVGVWRALNRPHPQLRLSQVLEGLLEFSRGFGGTLITETMLVDGVNTGGLEAVAELVARLRPSKAYISVPTRPPAEPHVRPPGAAKLVEAFRAFADRLGEGRVELLNLPEPPPPPPRWDPVAWLTSTASVHPLRLEHALAALEGVVDDPWEVISRLESEGAVEVVEYSGARYIVRRVGSAASDGAGPRDPAVSTV